MKPTLEQVLEFAQTGVEPLPPPPLPTPHEIALRLACALLAGGHHRESPEAAVGAGWSFVLPYYEGQRVYESTVRARAEGAEIARRGGGGPAVGFQFTAGPAESWGARAAGGETGFSGEGLPPGGSGATIHTSMEIPPINPALMQARQREIHETTVRVQAAQKALSEANALPKNSKGRKAKLAAAESEWDAACLAQSKAHEMPYQ